MDEVIKIGSMLLLVAPILMGFGAYAGLWLKEEFYSAPLYDDYED